MAVRSHQQLSENRLSQKSCVNWNMLEASWTDLKHHENTTMVQQDCGKCSKIVLEAHYKCTENAC